MLTNALAITVRDESDRLKPCFTFTGDAVGMRSDANGGGFTIALTCDARALVFAASVQASGDGNARAQDRADDLAHTVRWAVEHPNDEGRSALPFSSDWSLVDVRPNPLD